MKALLVILNKDNAGPLKECLNSISKIKGLCEDFDVLILDGASKDNSREISEKFEKKYPCVKFKVQERLGGTGFARREACDYARDNGYWAIIWGDSENVYHEEYAIRLLEKLKDNDAVGGVPLVKGNFYAHAFAWYHALHLVFPGLYKVHIPGNNKAEKVEIYEKVRYPETLRSEDYGFSILARKKGVKFKQDVAKDAIVEVSLPENFKEVRAWQRARAKGVAQVLRDIEVKPWDNLAWGFAVLFFLIFGLLIPFSYIPLLIYTVLFILAGIGIFFASKRYIKNPKNRYFFAPVFGLFIYSIYSLKAVFIYLGLKRKKK